MGLCRNSDSLLLFKALIFWSLGHILNTQDRVSAMLTVGVVTILTSHVLINIGMTIGLMPVVGYPCPSSAMAARQCSRKCLASAYSSMFGCDVFAPMNSENLQFFLLHGSTPLCSKSDWLLTRWWPAYRTLQFSLCPTTGWAFLFRLEDTDQQRLVEGSEQDLLQMLQWAGVNCDEGPNIGGEYGPYRQSERLALYQNHLQILMDSGHAYPCFCKQERLDNLKQQQKAQGLNPKYDGHCRELKATEVQQRQAGGEAYVIRMRIPDDGEKILIDDLIRGHVSIDSSQLDDQVLLKSDGFPTYHLACVVDDHLMEITHVVRGKSGSLPSPTPSALSLLRLGTTAFCTPSTDSKPGSFQAQQTTR